jgi:hypothetical protein
MAHLSEEFFLREPGQCMSWGQEAQFYWLALHHSLLKTSELLLELEICHEK